jgi:hypothetical protein
MDDVTVFSPAVANGCGLIRSTSMESLAFGCSQWQERGIKQINIMEMILRRFAGSFILVSLLLAYFHSLYWLWFTAFVGFNLLQSSFTNLCPLEMILKKIGVGQSSGTTG